MNGIGNTWTTRRASGSHYLRATDANESYCWAGFLQGYLHLDFHIPGAFRVR